VIPKDTPEVDPEAAFAASSAYRERARAVPGDVGLRERVTTEDVIHPLHDAVDVLDVPREIVREREDDQVVEHQRVRAPGVLALGTCGKREPVALVRA